MRREGRGGKGGGRPAPAAHAQPPLQCGAGAASSSNPVPRVPGAQYPLSRDVFPLVGRGGRQETGSTGCSGKAGPGQVGPGVQAQPQSP